MPHSPVEWTILAVLILPAKALIPTESEEEFDTLDEKVSSMACETTAISHWRRKRRLLREKYGILVDPYPSPKITLKPKQ